MEQFCKGDAPAFDALFKRHARLIKSFLVRACGNLAAAEDLTQMTFLSLARARDRFRPGSRFKPWIYAIALNAARDYRRQHREELLPDGVLPTSLAAEPALAHDAPLERAVHRALEQLPDKLREAIVLHRFEGLSFSEIAEIEGVSPVAVRVRAHRGYEQLRDLLRGTWEGP
jgi:RNA polymerase sigma factor (sigma-70 family)